MRASLKNLVLSATSALALTGFTLPQNARAQTYPIDCAILLCLAGGWPASVPCTRARAEFTRRITPWPIEPPLQIWRCPMGASYEDVPPLNTAARILDAGSETHGNGPTQSISQGDLPLLEGAIQADWRLLDGSPGLPSWDDAFQLVQDRADIDISGAEFNFVRSIRVFDVRFVRQRESDNTGECNRGERVLLGSYGIQGEFTWQASSTAALPAAHSGLERYGEDCPDLYHQSVFVEWRDYAGRYGFEQINY